MKKRYGRVWAMWPSTFVLQRSQTLITYSRQHSSPLFQRDRQGKGSFFFSTTSTSQKSEEQQSFVELEWDKTPERETGVAVLRLNRPAKLNALTEDVGRSFMSRVEELLPLPSSRLRCILLTGQGKAFSAGGDLDFILQRTKDNALNNTETMLAFYKRFLRLREAPVPVVAGINGAAVGAGFCLAMLADIRIASRDAPLGLNFVKLGLHPGMAATHFLPQLLGPQLANYLLLTGELITGEEAERRGFVLRAVPTPKDAFENALQLARTIAAASPVAVRLVTKTIRARQDAELERNIVREADGQAHCYASPDILEGLAAVRDKRPPSFY